MKRFIIFTLIAAILGLAGCSNMTGPDPDNAAVDNDQATRLTAATAKNTSGVMGNSGLPGNATVLRLAGTGKAYDGYVPDIDDLYNASGHRIGTATDCLSEINAVGDGLALVGTTIFNLPNGTFMTRGYTTVQPITTSMPTPATHTTGAIPMNGNNGVLHGTGAYKKFEAQARLSGAVNLSKLDSDGLITFDCLFAIMPL
jgi:hypothetical protein